MIKKFFVLSVLFISSMFILVFGGNVYAAEENSEPSTQEVTTYPCKVVTSLSKGGDVLFDIEEGNVGDVVTAYVKADFLFNISTIQINGESVEINSDGKYQFALIEGDNVFSVEFKVNNEKLTEIAELVNGVKENGFTSLFTISNLLNVISWVISVFLSSGFFITLIKNRKLKSKTVDEVVDIVKETLGVEVAQALKSYLDNLMSPALNIITSKIDGINDCMLTFCRCFVLAQDDTPENRLAIINELTKLNNSDEKLTNKIREIVKQEQKVQEDKIVARNEAIENLKKANENIKIEEVSGDSYGQL